MPDAAEYVVLETHPSYRVGNDGSVWSIKRRKLRSERDAKAEELRCQGATLAQIADSLCYPSAASVLKVLRRLKKPLVWHELRPWKSSKGYLFLSIDGIRYPVSHLVLIAFHGPRPQGKEACHGPDPDRTNNSASNLRWDTHRNNLLDRNEHGTSNHGQRNGQAKLTAGQVATIRSRVLLGDRRKTIARDFNVSLTAVALISTGKRWAKNV